MGYGRQERVEGTRTHTLNHSSLAPYSDSCWQQGAKSMHKLSLLSPKSVLKSHYQFHYFYLTHLKTPLLLEAHPLSTALHRRLSGSARLELPLWQIRGTDLGLEKDESSIKYLTKYFIRVSLLPCCCLPRSGFADHVMKVTKYTEVLDAGRGQTEIRGKQVSAFSDGNLLAIY